jgi:hypothetical protein
MGTGEKRREGYRVKQVYATQGGYTARARKDVGFSFVKPPTLLSKFGSHALLSLLVRHAFENTQLACTVFTSLL